MPEHLPTYLSVKVSNT